VPYAVFVLSTHLPPGLQLQTRCLFPLAFPGKISGRKSLEHDYAFDVGTSTLSHDGLRIVNMALNTHQQCHGMSSPTFFQPEYK